MNIADLIEREGGNASFSRAFGIPLKTVEHWKSGRREPPEYNVRIYDELARLRRKSN